MFLAWNNRLQTWKSLIYKHKEIFKSSHEKNDCFTIKTCIWCKFAEQAIWLLASLSTISLCPSSCWRDLSMGTYWNVLLNLPSRTYSTGSTTLNFSSQNCLSLESDASGRPLDLAWTKGLLLEMARLSSLIITWRLY